MALGKPVKIEKNIALTGRDCQSFGKNWAEKMDHLPSTNRGKMKVLDD